MTAVLPQELSWCRGGEAEFRSELVDLVPWRGRTPRILVGEQQTALILADRTVRLSLASGEHELPIEGGEMLLFVYGAELRAPRAEFGSFAVDARLRIAEPARFYDLFLRNAEDLSPEQFGKVLSCLISDCCRRWMNEQGTTHPSRGLADELQIAAGASLATCGLELLRLDLLAGSGMSETRELTRA